MTAEEHIIAWIESSAPHYSRLLKLSDPNHFRTDTSRAFAAASLSIDAYQEMVRGGDAYANEHDAGSILRAAIELLAWRLEP